MKENTPFPVDQYNDPAWKVWANSGKVAIATSRQHPYEFFEDMDRMLKPYGLEVVVYDSGSTDYWYSIEKMEEAK